MNQWLRENRVFIGFLLCFGLFRTAIADYNPIPSGSMHPNLLEGDVVLVNRLAFDLKIPLTRIALAHLGDPQRGDIITCFSPHDDVRLIKRVVGLPGDTIEMRRKRLFVNGEPADYAVLGSGSETLAGGEQVPALRVLEDFGGSSHEIQWLPVATTKDDFAPIRIPDGHYLVLGDNRDRSQDSRYIGLVPRRLIIGRAHHILVSANTAKWSPRFERFGRRLE